jgi:hypothetical protein
MQPFREFREAGGRVLPTGRLPVGDLAVVAAIGAIAVVGGAFAVRSLQAATALTLLVLLLAVYSQSRRAGLIGLWTIWLLTPALRRIVALAEGTPGADPLALLPFIATGVLALIELRRTTMSSAARTTLGIAALGFLIGAPMGLLADPLAFGFALTAYLAGLFAFAIGWADARGDGRLTLVQVLMVALPPIALYGVLQYFFPLTSWDANWIASVDLESIGAPQEGHIRIFSTLNSPGTLGLVLAVGLVLGLSVRRRPGLAVPATAVLASALALTFVRSAWLALAFGLLVYAAAARGRSAGKLVGVIAVCLVALVVIGGSNPTTRAFTQRVTSLGELSEDDSAQERLSFTSQLLPTAVGQPLGAGVGQAGLAVRLDEGGGDGESLATTDNGYLALLYQVGLVGFLFVVIAMARSVVAAVRGLGSSEGPSRQARAAVLAALVTLLVAQAGGDMLYGITGAVFWYLAGVALAGEPSADPRRSRLDARPK